MTGRRALDHLFGESFQEAAAQSGIGGMWRSVVTGSSSGSYALDPGSPFQGRQSQRITFASGTGQLGVENRGLNRWGISFEAGKPYDGYIYLRSSAAVQVSIAAESTTGTIAGPGGKCIDVSGDDSGGNGAAVQLWDCQSSAADQRWTHAADDTLRPLGRCLDIADNGTAAGAKLQLWDCNGVSGQKWHQQADGSFQNPASGHCIDSPNGATNNGTRLQIWDCSSAGAQKFSHGSTRYAETSFSASGSG